MRRGHRHDDKFPRNWQQLKSPKTPNKFVPRANHKHKAIEQRKLGPWASARSTAKVTLPKLKLPE